MLYYLSIYLLFYVNCLYRLLSMHYLFIICYHLLSTFQQFIAAITLLSIYLSPNHLHIYLPSTISIDSCPCTISIPSVTISCLVSEQFIAANALPSISLSIYLLLLLYESFSIDCCPSNTSYHLLQSLVQFLVVHSCHNSTFYLSISQQSIYPSTYTVLCQLSLQTAAHALSLYHLLQSLVYFLLVHSCYCSTIYLQIYLSTYLLLLLYEICFYRQLSMHYLFVSFFKNIDLLLYYLSIYLSISHPYIYRSLTAALCQLSLQTAVHALSLYHLLQSQRHFTSTLIGSYFISLQL